MKTIRLSILGFLLLTLAQMQAMAQNKLKKKEEPTYKNLLAFHPLHANADDFIGIGFSYERAINDNFGVKIPLMMALNQPYVNLGVSARFYPRKKKSDPVVYAIAPTLYVGKGEDHNRIYSFDPVTGFGVESISKTPRTQVGFILNHSLNIYVAQQVYLGLEGGIGINYFDNKAFRNNDNNLSFAAQFHMAVGYRF